MLLKNQKEYWGFMEPLIKLFSGVLPKRCQNQSFTLSVSKLILSINTTQEISDMSTINFRKVLLAGTALVGVASFGQQAQAAAFAHTAAAIASGASGTWAESTAGVQGQADSSDIAHAGHGDTLNLASGADVKVTNDTTADDGSADSNTFQLGAVTNTATGTITIISGTTATLGVTIASSSTGGNISVKNHNAANAATTAAWTGGLTITGTGTLVLLNQQATTNSKTVAATVGGNLSIASGVTTITGAAAKTGASSSLAVTGNAAFGGLVSLIGGAGDATNTASLTLSGTTNTFSAGAVLDDNTGLTTLTLNGTGAQGVTGAIDGGAAANEGAIVVSNDGGEVTFNSNVGTTKTVKTVTVGKAGTTAQGVTFKGDLKTGTAAVLGAGAGVAVITATFDNTNGAQAVAGILNGDGTDTAKVVVSGGHTTTTSGVWGAAQALSDVKVTGSGTILSAGATIDSTTFTLASGGTLQASSAATFRGTNGGADTNIDGAGTLDIDAATTVVGSIGKTTALTAIDVANNITLTVSAANANQKIQATTINLSGVANDATLALTLGNNVEIMNAVTTTTDGKGVISDGAGGAAGTITFDADIGASGKALKAITLTDNAAVTSITTSNDLYVGTITIGQNDVLTLSGNDTNQFVSGVIDGAGSKGTLTLSGGSGVTQTIGGLIGGGATLATINAGQTAGATVFTSLAKADTLNVGTGTVTLNGGFTGNTVFASANGTVTIADNKNLTGSIEGTGGVVGTGIGKVVFSGTTSGVTTVSNAGGILKSITLSGTGETVTTAGNFKSADTLTLGDNTLTIGGGGTFTAGAAQTIASTVDSATVYGHATSAGNATINTNSLLNLTVDTSVYIPTATTLTIVNGAAGAGVATLAAGKLTVNGVNSGAGTTVVNGVITYSQTGGGTDDLKVLVTRAAADTVSTTANGDAVGDILDAIGVTAGGTTGDTALDAALGALQNATTADEVDAVLERLTPTVDGSANTGTLEANAQVEAVADTRMASLRSGDGDSGVAAGVTANGTSLWMEGFGQTAKQDRRSGIAGYDADTWGGAIGADSTNLSSNGVIGAMFSYGKTNSDSKNQNLTNTDVDSYGFNVYGTFDVGQKAFVSGQLGYAWNDISHLRHDTDGVAGSGNNSAADYSSNQYSAKLAVGQDYTGDYGMTITPSISAAYTFLDVDGYSETGTGVNQTVDSDTMNVLNFGVGVNAAWKMQNADGSMLKPAVHLGYAYDAIGDKVETSSFFTNDPGGAANSFRTNGPDPARSRFDAGVGLTYMTAANWDLSANYNYTYKQDYDAHSGVLRLTSHF